MRKRQPPDQPAKVARIGGPAIQGDRVKGLRETRGWTLMELGYRAKMQISDVSRVEHGKLDVRSSTLLRLVIALRTSADYLLGLSDDPRPAKT